MSESSGRLATGPRGQQGIQGARGERGLSRIQGRAVVVLFVIAVAFGLFGLFWTAQEIGANDHKFCQVISGIVPVPRPADPKANPSRETAYEQYERFASLGRSLGC